MELRDRIAVVTGGASGIGAAVVERLALEGALGVRWDVADGADVYCDVRDQAAVVRALAQTIERYGVPTLLVAAAAVPVRGRLLELGVEEWDETFAVNTRGVFLCLQAVSRAIVETGRDGSMVLVSSVNGMIADPGIPSYSASKAAVYHLARCAAVELGAYGIRVNAVGPGPTDTPMIAVNMRTPGYREAVTEATPLGRMGTPELVADGIVNVLRSEWITGQAIMVDGGAALVTPRGRARMVGRERRAAAVHVA